jgi:hypothetical protein
MNTILEGWQIFYSAFDLWKLYTLKSGKCDIFWYLIDCEVNLWQFYEDNNLVDYPVGDPGVDDNADTL